MRYSITYSAAGHLLVCGEDNKKLKERENIAFAPRSVLQPPTMRIYVHQEHPHYNNTVETNPTEAGPIQSSRFFLPAMDRGTLKYIPVVGCFWHTKYLPSGTCSYTWYVLRVMSYIIRKLGWGISVSTTYNNQYPRTD